MAKEPTHEVWGGYCNVYGECDNPEHLEDCFSKLEAIEAANDWCKNKDFYAFVREK